jgi:CheY-like chemotaxis protein
MPTVLIVEDEAMIRDVVKDELEDAGYSVILAPHADAAIAILEARQDIHLVFTDIDMPGSMDGLKLAACVRDRWPPVHIIITTGKAPACDDSCERAVYSQTLRRPQRRRGDADLRKHVRNRRRANAFFLHE